MEPFDDTNAEPQRGARKDRGAVADALATWLVRRSCDGLYPLASAADLAAQYEKRMPNAAPDRRVEAMIRWEAGKSFSASAVTSLGGIIMAPVSVPASFAVTWLLQARMVATMAALYGHDLSDPWVHTGILAALEDGRAPEALGRVGQQVAQWGSAAALGKLSPQAATFFRRTLANKLLKRAGSGRAMRLLRMAPVVGAVISGGMDAYGANIVARQGQRLFRAPPKKV